MLQCTSTLEVPCSVAVHYYIGGSVICCSRLLLVWNAVLQYTAIGVEYSVSVHCYECGVQRCSIML